MTQTRSRRLRRAILGLAALTTLTVAVVFVLTAWERADRDAHGCDPFACVEPLPAVKQVLRDERINPEGLSLSPLDRARLDGLVGRINAQHAGFRKELHQTMWLFPGAQPADVPELAALDASSRRVVDEGIEELARFVAVHGYEN